MRPNFAQRQGRRELLQDLAGFGSVEGMFGDHLADEPLEVEGRIAEDEGFEDGVFSMDEKLADGLTDAHVVNHRRFRLREMREGEQKG